MAKMPKLCHHKARQLGYVTPPRSKIPVYFVGRWPRQQKKPPGDIEAQYLAWVGEYCRAEALRPPKARDGLTILELADRYTDHVGLYYRKNGRPTTEVGSIKRALASLLAHPGYKEMAATQFGPAHLREIRVDLMAARHLRDGTKTYSRKQINEQISRVRRMFRWAEEHGLVPEGKWGSLKAVSDLGKGRFEVREEEPIEAVAAEVVERSLPILDAYRPVLGAMVRVQVLTGCRPTEVCVMRAGDIDRQADGLWLYTVPVGFDKTEHRDQGQQRYWLGPRAQAVLAPWLLSADPWVFPLKGPRSHARTRKTIGRYTRDTYRAAIRRALRRYNDRNPDDPISLWFPLQLRHTAGQEVRDQHEKGIQATQARLGHKEVTTSQIYASEIDVLARDVARRFG